MAPKARVRGRCGAAESDGCDRLDEVAGWCRKHYIRVRKYGDPTVDRRAIQTRGDGRQTCSGPCGRLLPLAAFGVNRARSTGVNAWCRRCRNERQIVFRERKREEAYARLGSACAVCGETDPEVLELDHVNDDGYVDRAAAGFWGGYTDVQEILAMDDPAAKYQLLCANDHRRKTRAWARDRAREAARETETT